MSEDIHWSLHLYNLIDSIYVLDEPIYIYRQQRVGSITNTNSLKRIDSLIQIIDYWYNYEYENEKSRELYYNYLAYQYIILLTIVNKKDIRRKIDKFNTLLQYNKNYKVKLATNLFKILGIFLGSKILGIYLKLKNNGIVKI